MPEVEYRCALCNWIRHTPPQGFILAPGIPGGGLGNQVLDLTDQSVMPRNVEETRHRIRGSALTVIQREGSARFTVDLVASRAVRTSDTSRA